MHREGKCIFKTKYVSVFSMRLCHLPSQVEEYADDIFARLESGAHMYFCGLKGMMPGIQDMLKAVCDKKDLKYDEFIAKLKKAGQWHVEVY